MNWKPAKLSTTEFVAGLTIKILLGFLYGYIYLHYYNGDDTWRFQRVSLEETNLLLHDPATFFINEFTPLHALNEGTGWREVLTLYLNDLQYALVVKLLAIFNLVSGGNYYINCAIFNLIFFWGHYWTFGVFTSFFPEKRKFFYWGAFFFLPAVFWLSGIRVDGWLFFFLALLIYSLSHKTIRFRFFLIFLAYAGVVIARSEVAVLIVPAAIGYLLSKKMFSWQAYAISIFLCICLFFCTSLFTNSGGLPGAVAAKQQLFQQLEGTRFELPQLDITPASYLKVLPHALLNTFVRPFPWETNGLLQAIASLEIVIFWLMLIWTALHAERDWRIRLMHPVILFILFVSLGIYLSVGYLVPFPGAIIRYKAPALLMLVLIMVSATKLKRI